MNSLSWFLYVVDVLGNLAVLLTFMVVASGLYVAARTVITAMVNSHNEYEIEHGRCGRMPYPDYMRWGVFVFALTVLGVLMPSKNTLYAIAASEAGERIVKTEAVQGIATDAQKALRAWIKRQIEPDAPKVVSTR